MRLLNAILLCIPHKTHIFVLVTMATRLTPRVFVMLPIHGRTAVNPAVVCIRGVLIRYG